MVIDSLTGKTSWGSTRGLGFTPPLTLAGWE